MQQLSQHGASKTFVFGGCPSLTAIAWINIMTKSNLRRKGFIWFTLSHYNVSVKEVRAGTEAGPEAETMEGSDLLTCSLWLA